MICPNCQKEIADNSIYCVNCGYKASEALQNNPNMQGSLPPPQQSLAASVQSKPKRSFKKALPFIIGGGVLAAAAAVFCCMKFAAADIVHGVMGDEKYASTMTKGIVTALARSDYVDSALISALSSSLSPSCREQYDQYIKDHPESELNYYEFAEILTNSSRLSSIGRQLPENGLYAKAKINTELTDKFHKLIAEALNTEKEEIKRAFEDLNSFGAEGKFSVKEDGLDFGYLISQKKKELDSGNVYYNTKEGSLYYLNPSVYSSALRTNAAALEIDLKKQEYGFDKAKTEKERSILIKKISEIYAKHIKNAETEYSDVTENVGEGEFKGRSMIVTFENESLVKLLRDITNAFYDSDYFGSISQAAFGGAVPDSIDIDSLKEKAEKNLDALADFNDKISLTLELYINSDNSLAGILLKGSSGSGENKYTTQIKYIGTKSDFYLAVRAGGITYVKCEGAKTSPDSGTAEITLSIPKTFEDETQKLKIAVEYSDLGQKEAFGGRQVLGNFNVKVSGSLLDELSLRSDGVDYGALVRKTDFNLSAKDRGSGIEYGIELKNETYGNISFTVELGENTEPVFDRTGMTKEDAVNMQWDNIKTLDAEIGMLKHIGELCEKSELLKSYFKYTVGEDYIDNIDGQIEELENNRKYKEVYSNFDKNKTAWRAQIDAYNLYKALTSSKTPLQLKSKEPFTVKIYYDIAGKMNIIDMSGEDESLLKSIKNLHWNDSSYKNLYVEINYCYKVNQYAPVGVTVVMTDNRDNIPEKLPSIYNYIDKLYPWENEVSYIEPYVVGTYPELEKGDSACEEELKQLADEVDRYNEYAQKGFEAFNSFLKDTGNSLIYPDHYKNPLPIELTIQSGEWSDYQSSVIMRYFEISFEKEDLFKYLKENVPEIKDGCLILYIYDNNIIGASFSDIDYKLCSAIYLAGATSEWGIIDGVTDSVHENWNNPNPMDYAIGTYPVIKSYNGTLSEEITKLMTGNWVRIYDSTQTITITEDDIKHITKITSFTNGNLEFIFSFDDGTEYSIHLNITGLIFYEDKPYNKVE